MIISEVFNLTLTDHISIFQKFEKSGLFEILWCEKLSEDARDSDNIFDFSISLKEGDFDEFVKAIYNIREIIIKPIDISLTVSYGFAGQCNLWINTETLHKISEMKLDLSISCYEVNDEEVENKSEANK
jgi:hypothetical protein